MKPRSLKYLALVLSGGVLLQFGGCTGFGVDLLAQLVFSSVLRGIVQALAGAGGAV